MRIARREVGREFESERQRTGLSSPNRFMLAIVHNTPTQNIVLLCIDINVLFTSGRHWRSAHRLCAIPNCSQRKDWPICSHQWISSICEPKQHAGRLENENSRVCTITRRDGRTRFFFLSLSSIPFVAGWIALTSLQANKIVYCAHSLTCKCEARDRERILWFKKWIERMKFVSLSPWLRNRMTR